MRFDCCARPVVPSIVTRFALRLPSGGERGAPPLSGDFAAKSVARRQPAKLAAMEAHYHTQGGAPLIIGGLPNDATERVAYAIEIPYGLSILAHGDPHAEVTGLDRIPPADQPPTRVVHLAFQVMVGAGVAMAVLGLCLRF